MCKVLIKKVNKVHPPFTGETDKRPWTIHSFDCVVTVDGNAEVVRRVKTFEADIAQKIGELTKPGTLVFEAEKKKEGSFYEYTVKKPKKTAKPRASAKGPTNREIALELSTKLWSARAPEEGVPSDDQVLGSATKFLEFLEPAG